MDDARRHTILQAAISVYGGNAQIDVAIEEMSELVKALLKDRRTGNEARSITDKATLIKDILEEMADVKIMLDQLQIIYGDTAEYEEMKLQRLCERIRKSHGTLALP